MLSDDAADVQIDAMDGEPTTAPREEREVPCERTIGAAGTGKTTLLLQRTEDDPTYGLLTSTTGVSAVNLGATTIHATLRYSDTQSLRDAYLTGRLARTLHEIALSHRRLIVEEYSMADADQLDLWYRGVQEANRYLDVKEPLGIMLVGDLAQLPPVKARWCFEADCWPAFAAHTTRLEHVYRQDGGPFLDALNQLREGAGRRAADILSGAGAVWHTSLDNEFDGTTILPKNGMVNRYNSLALARVKGRLIPVESRRWGKQRPEWGQSMRTKEWGIPPRTEFKIGAYVMILANAPDFSVVNGDCGHIVDFADGLFSIRLVRTGEVIRLGRLVRGVEQHERPDGWTSDLRLSDSVWMDAPHFRKKVRRYVLGQVEWYPLRLAYASTVHKSQSLTLDRVQLDFRDRFFGMPAMLYTGCSRVRTLEGLRLVGAPERFAAQANLDRRIVPWL